MFVSNPADAAQDPFSLAALIAWLEKQPGSEPYDWFSTCDCLVGQYFQAVMGWESPGSMTIYSKHFGGHYVQVAGYEPWTFGAALSRALSLQSQQSAK